MPFNGILPPSSYYCQLTRILHHYINMIIIAQFCFIVNNFLFLSVSDVIDKHYQKFPIAVNSLENSLASFRHNVCAKLTAVKPIKFYRGIFTLFYVFTYTLTQVVKTAFNVQNIVGNLK